MTKLKKHAFEKRKKKTNSGKTLELELISQIHDS
jgi:hypothetical protein